MKMVDQSTELLQRFSRDRCEAAFRELVRLHSGLVYGTALRQLGGDRAAAQDVMQEVFTLLVRKAETLDGVLLSAWLYRQTCRRAINHLRAESRRRKRELVAVATMGSGSVWDADRGESADLAGEIDHALLGLPSKDRDVLMLRFFEERDFRGVGSALAISEEAARKRTSRALERLADLLRRRGVIVGSASTLGPAMTGMAATPVPAAMISQVSAQALKALPVAGWSALLPLLKTFFYGVLMTSLVAAPFTVFRPGRTAAASSANNSKAGFPLERKVSTSRLISAASGARSLESMVDELRRLKSGPDNFISKMKIEMLLDSVPDDRIGEFLALLSPNLSPRDAANCTEWLTRRWMQSDPSAATAFSLKQRIEDVSGKSGSGSTGYSVASGYGAWLTRDFDAALDWLDKEWSNPGLEKKENLGKTLRSDLTVMAATEWLRRQEVQKAFGMIGRLPESPDRQEAWNQLAQALCGDQGVNVSPATRVEFFRRIADDNDPEQRQALRNFVTSCAERYPDELKDLPGKLNAAEKFQYALALASGDYRPGKVLPDPQGGKLQISGTSADLEPLWKLAVEAGQAAGVDDGEVRHQVAQALAASHLGVESIPAIRNLLDSDDADELIAARAVNAARATSWSGSPPPVSAILWAASISAPELRLSFARGLFLDALKQDQFSGQNTGETIITDPSIPGDLKMEFRNLLNSQP